LDITTPLEVEVTGNIAHVQTMDDTCSLEIPTVQYGRDDEIDYSERVHQAIIIFEVGIGL